MIFKLTSRIPQIVVEIPRAVDAAIEQGAQDIAEEAQARVPVATGSLRDAIHVEKVEGGYSVVAGDSATFYGHIVENGGARTPAQPFLVPAFESCREAMFDAIEDALEDV